MPRLVLLLLLGGLLSLRVAQAQLLRWNPLPAPPGNSTALAAHPVSGHLLMSTYTSGLYRSNDSGNSWQQVYRTNTDENFYAVAVRPDGVVFAGGIGAVFRSLDGGTTWSKFTVGGGHAISSIVFDADGRIYVGTQAAGVGVPIPSSRVGAGVFISADNGQTWSPMNTGLSATTGCVGRLHITAQGQLYAALHDQGQTDTGGIFAWDATAGTWRALPLRLNATGPVIRPRYIYALAWHNNMLYVALEGAANSLVYRLMIKSADGQAWQRAFVAAEQPSFSEQPHPFSLFVTSPSSPAGSALLGHMSSVMSPPAGVYRLRGGAWELDAGPVEAEQPLHFAQTASGQLFALEGYNQHFFCTSLVSAAASPRDEVYAVRFQPNSARAGTTVAYILPAAAQVSILVTNALGQAVTGTPAQPQAAGPHQYQWPAQGAAPGLYLIRIQIGSEHITKRLVVN